MSKQTAVEWLKLQLETYGDPQYCELTWKELDELCEQAKEMEREQIEEAFLEGQEYEYQYHVNGTPKFDLETYFIETYKGGEQ